MVATVNFLAVDLGAESGRVVAGFFTGDQLALKEIYRFPNGPVRVLDSLYWDMLRLWDESKRGLRLYTKTYGAELAGIGVDTWGVDFALLDRDGALLGNPYHYRDRRTEGMMEEAFRRVPREEIFQCTGIQFLPINTLYQLLAMAVQGSPTLGVAGTFLMMPDLFNFWFSGQKVCEFTDATTTQFYNPRYRDWARPMLGKMGLPTHILPEVVSPGTVLGLLLPSMAEEVGLKRVPVIATASHDTASAVAAVPVLSIGTGPVGRRDYVYVSSGTWSLMGAEVREPVITNESLAYNFTNEGGVGGTFRFLKNIMGLWLLQECRRTWVQAGEEFSYDDLTAMAAQAQPFEALVEPDDPTFLSPGDMPARIQAFCQQTAQPVPQDKGSVVRCILESLALKYRWVLEKLEVMLGWRCQVVHIVGGGVQNRLLCQFTANATGRPVVAGPIEATAIGNILIQAQARGHLTWPQEAREIVHRSFEVRTYEPQETATWNEAYNRFLRLSLIPLVSC
jgi:rhamnulokinase